MMYHVIEQQDTHTRKRKRTSMKREVRMGRASTPKSQYNPHRSTNKPSNNKKRKKKKKSQTRKGRST